MDAKHDVEPAKRKGEAVDVECVIVKGDGRLGTYAGAGHPITIGHLDRQIRACCDRQSEVLCDTSVDEGVHGTRVHQSAQGLATDLHLQLHGIGM